MFLPEARVKFSQLTQMLPDPRLLYFPNILEPQHASRHIPGSATMWLVLPELRVAGNYLWLSAHL
jgi:hypothetical protein